MTASLFRLEVRRSRTLVGWLAIVSAAYAGIIAGFYPTMLENSALLNDYMSLWPRELMAAFGMEGGLSDPGTFFHTYVGGMLWPVVAAMAGILLATRSTAADAERGWAELTLATPVSRNRYLLVAIANQILMMALLAAATVGAILVVGAIVGPGFDAGRFALAGVGAFVFGCAIAAVTTLLGTLTLSRGIAGGAVAGLLLAMYLLQAIAKIQPNLDWVGFLSAFHYYDAAAMIDRGVVPWADFTVFVVTSLLAWAASLVVFRRRDVLA